MNHTKSGSERETRKTKDHMKKEYRESHISSPLQKESPGHWKRWWAAATLIPFCLAFFLSWYFGAPGGYEPFSQVKVFLLFLQVGFVTAYFIRHHLKRAAVHLWLTIGFLWLLSLIVPYLASQTEVLLDMSDVSGELSTPLYLFVSCLSAAWILPGKARMIARIACVVLIILYILVQFTYIGYYVITHSLISINMLLALAQTNLAETMEYIEVNIPYAEIAAGVAALLILGWLIFKASRFSFNREQVSRKTWFGMLLLFFVNVGLCALSIGGTRLAHVYYETYETLHSFSDFQKMVNARRHMHIADKDIVRQLKAAPDGVYVLVIGESLTRDQFRLYQLIWRRFAASRMAPARYETTSVKIGAGEYVFTVAASKVAFDGFMSVYTEEGDDKKGNILSQSLEKGMELKLKELKPEQHFTQPPAHYTEASLVKTMEELGIGRPSTYAPTITTIISRRYVSKEQKNLYVTELGEVVNNIMKQAFPSIVDVNFTATMEGLLDCVEAGTVQWKTVVRNFYPDLKHDVDEAEKELKKVDIQDEVTDVVCDNCGRNMVIKYGPHGRFLACPGFPDCRNTKPYYEKIGVACPKCGGEIVMKKTKKGRKYYGCENNPECDFMSWQKPSAKKCPKCGNYMLEKGNKLVCSQETCGYVEQKPKDED